MARFFSRRTASVEGDEMTGNGSGSAVYLLGFDGGGTKTACVLAGADGKVLFRSTAGPSNPLRSGYARAWFSLSEAANIVLDRQKITSNHIQGVCAGIGGAGRPAVARRLAQFFERSFPNAEVEVVTDLDIALEAAFGSGEGIILVAGTGSAALGRDRSGRKVRMGGGGPWFSDEGSGFDIGRRAVTAVLLAEENRGPSTALSARLFRFLSVRTWSALIDEVSRDPDSVFPRVFPLVAELADEGDSVAREILSSAAKSLVGLASAAAEKLGWRDKEVPVALIGGMHGRSKFFDAEIDAELSKALPHAKCIELKMTPAEAAVRIASRALGNASSIG
ncbi:MAG TPA: BadF/BadG/BcrA/BcrD ATPase family protein [Candidatus Cybelea sp.]|nr:BadF/BadG/BcrA/BcrD ATPase family protein [Candidatus Cybelea sp.]